MQWHDFRSKESIPTLPVCMTVVGKRKFHSTACQRAVNSQTAPDRMKRSRANKRFKQVKPQLIKLRKLAERLRLSEILAAFPEFRRLDPQLLSQIVERKKYRKE